MKLFALIFGLLAGIFLSTPSFCEDTQKFSIDVIPYCGSDGFNALGPMPVMVHVFNRSDGKVALLEDYAQGSGIEVRISGVECESAIKYNGIRVGARHLTIIKPGSEFAYPLYLTNIYRFIAPGIAQISWNAKIHVLVNEDAETVESAGNFPLKIRQGNRDELERDLARLFDYSMNVVDLPTKMGEIEGICSVRDPAVLPYLQRLLNVHDGESRAVETLIKIWNNDPIAEKIVSDYFDTTSNPETMKMIISLFQQRRKLLSENQLSHLLKSKDEAIRFCGIVYIRGILDSLHIADSIPQYSGDPSPGIAAQCDEILKVFTDILNKNESKSFKRQNAAKQSANGF